MDSKTKLFFCDFDDRVVAIGKLCECHYGRV